MKQQQQYSHFERCIILFILSKKQQILNSDENEIKWKGNIPIEIGNLTNLRELYLSGNQLSGWEWEWEWNRIFEDYFILFICEMWNEIKMKEKFHLYNIWNWVEINFQVWEWEWEWNRIFEDYLIYCEMWNVKCEMKQNETKEIFQ